MCIRDRALVDRMIGYGVFTEGTEVISFDKTGEEENAKGVLNLNQAKNNEGVTETQFLVEIGNTFIENFELSTLTAVSYTHLHRLQRERRYF